MKAIERCYEFTVDAGREDVFALLSDARNLDALTPNWFAFEIVSADAGRMGEGIEIEYRLRWRLTRCIWRSRVFNWRPLESFAYEQVEGPFRSFVHEHDFEDAAGGGTRVIDRVTYAPPGGALADRLLVAPDLERIFSYREQQVAQLLGRPIRESVRLVAVAE
jgi:ligand-binding SRPBCC domain-containing protein